MPTSLSSQSAERDASAKRRRSWVQRAWEAPDGQDHDLRGVRCPSRLRGRQFATAFLEVQLELWDAAGPHDSGLQNLMEGSACADVLSAWIPLAFRG